MAELRAAIGNEIPFCGDRAGGDAPSLSLLTQQSMLKALCDCIFKRSGSTMGYLDQFFGPQFTAEFTHKLYQLLGIIALFKYNDM
jgi:hypothetical protein